ncbi:MAG: cyclopropane-fatty-acyl-phospholipid synthase family protein [Planctomycetaceae bacterium]
MTLLQAGIEAVERGIVPDAITRSAIRRLCAHRLQELESGVSANSEAPFLRSLRTSPIALVPGAANQQHYELPPEFFAAFLGPQRKYSCCYWPEGVQQLEDAEEAALRTTAERGELSDGQEILELGCGWGSLSLWMAANYPQSRIVAVSNSTAQKRFIDAEAAARGLSNLQVVTVDMNDFGPAKHAALNRTFDRVVSVEMFEHMRNFPKLLQRIAARLKPQGKLFVHHFCHRRHTYPFETEGETNWMGRHFFTGGIMPSFDLLRHFDEDLEVVRQWHWNGTNYQRTAEAWLENFDRNERQIRPILRDAYGVSDARRWFRRWRVFLLSVSELFGYGGGDEWFVTHTLMQHNG